MYKYVIGKWADPVVATAVGVISFVYYEAKQREPSLYALITENHSKPNERTNQPN